MNSDLPNLINLTTKYWFPIQQVQLLHCLNIGSEYKQQGYTWFSIVLYTTKPIVITYRLAIRRIRQHRKPILGVGYAGTCCTLTQYCPANLFTSDIMYYPNPFSQYARSKRPADSVHWHAPSVPANLGRRISERMGRLTLGPYWPASRSKCVGRVSRFKCTGQWVSILAHGLVCISIFGCSQDVRHKLTKIVQLIIRSKRLGQPHVQSVWAERHLSSARANGSPY